MANGDEENGGNGAPSYLTVALQILGVAAGIAALATGVGGAMLWIRFDELQLPADQSVALLPRAVLVAIGAHALLGPLLVAGFAMLVLGLIAPFDDDGKPRGRAVVLLAVTNVLALIVTFFLVEDFEPFPYWLIMLVAIELGVLAVAITAARSRRLSYTMWVIFVVFALCGGLLSILRTTGAPKMEPVAVLLKPEANVEGASQVGELEGLSGFYVGQTSDRLYVAPLPGSGDPGDPFADADIDRIVEIARDDVLRLSMREPAELGDDHPGRQQAQAMLDDLRAAQRSFDEVDEEESITTLDPVVAFAPLVHLHPREPYLPMSAGRFIKHSTLAWAHAGCAPHVLVPRYDEDDPGRRPGLSTAAAQTGLGVKAAQQRTAYRHRASSSPERCGDDGGDVYGASEHTRPHDAKGRARDAKGEQLDVNEGFFLNVDDDVREGLSHEEKVEKIGAQAVLKPVPVYYEVQDEPSTAHGQDADRITYWLFYGLSRPPGPTRVTNRVTHEGDWERISILVKPGAGPNEVIPISVRYHFHEENRDVPWAAVRRAGSGGPEAASHPVVYSALGSHASYPRAGRFQQALRAGGRSLLVVYDEAFSCPGCPEWRTWELLWDARVQPWYGFGGAWGRVFQIGGTSGPLGPSRYKLGNLGTPQSPTASGDQPAGTNVEELEEEAETPVEETEQEQEEGDPASKDEGRP